MTPELQAILSELKARLTELYGERLEKLILFGSQARGDAEPDSDIDVLVVLKGEVDDSKDIHERKLDIIVDLSQRYNTLVCVTEMSSDRFHTRKSPLLINVRREGIQI
jgi:uncharacterized protein